MIHGEAKLLNLVRQWIIGTHNLNQVSDLCCGRHLRYIVNMQALVLCLLFFSSLLEKEKENDPWRSRTNQPSQPLDEWSTQTRAGMELKQEDVWQKLSAWGHQSYICFYFCLIQERNKKMIHGEAKQINLVGQRMIGTHSPDQV